ncbi:hypothetical protein BFF78_37450 [Streptomyces fodineus]|uniref:Intradiol ring-cleavage dioxygenases domain-containing protein n=1 Tax=Streptomyces fodineus TaxID=1904616 RepID=A0A1D7YK63_9ACTN|nr:hypothetical protein [Streptomyces fodineus]AOR35988.1 hypothetical protein BFF78_37450 [Streptomyces fodineus]
MAAPGLAATQATAATEHQAAARPAACVLTPEQTEGPYYLDLETVRRNITEGKAGVPPTLRVTMVDAATCAPLPQTAVDIWHCDALGRLLRLCRRWFHPGHHLYVKTHGGGTVSNGTYHGGHVSHRGQLYFPEAYNTRSTALSPYRAATP